MVESTIRVVEAHCLKAVVFGEIARTEGTEAGTRVLYVFWLVGCFEVCTDSTIETLRTLAADCPDM
jgi:hypothetical protein